jgi:hypothetical protein
MKIFDLLPKHFKWENSLMALNGVVGEECQSFNTYYKVRVGIIPCGPTIQKFGWWLVQACEDVSGWTCLNEQWWTNDKLNKQMTWYLKVFFLGTKNHNKDDQLYSNKLEGN